MGDGAQLLECHQSRQELADGVAQDCVVKHGHDGKLQALLHLHLGAETMAYGDSSRGDGQDVGAGAGSNGGDDVGCRVQRYGLTDGDDHRQADGGCACVALLRAIISEASRYAWFSPSMVH